MAAIQNSKITPFLWYNDNAEEAMNFYISIFKNSRVISVSSVGEGENKKVFSVSFELDGQCFHALNGGPHFSFTPAISFFISCEDQKEVDYYWGKLTAGGSEEQCGWLKDKFGLSWQVVPSVLGELIKNPNAMSAMLKMKKLDIQKLKEAAGL